MRTLCEPVDNDTTKSQYLMVNTAQVGLRTVDGYRYNYTTGSRAIVTLTLKRPKYKVTFNAGTGTSWGSATTKQQLWQEETRHP